MPETPGCCKRIYDRYVGGHSCSRSGVVERDGRHYCRQHDPIKVAERKAEWDRKYDERSAKDSAVLRRQIAEGRALHGIATEALESHAVAHVLAMARDVTRAESRSTEQQRAIEAMGELLAKLENKP